MPKRGIKEGALIGIVTGILILVTPKSFGPESQINIPSSNYENRNPIILPKKPSKQKENYPEKIMPEIEDAPKDYQPWQKGIPLIDKNASHYA